MSQSFDQLTEKWEPVLTHSDLPQIQDSYKSKVTACLLENQENAMREQALTEATPGNAMGGGFSVSAASSATGNLAGYDPVLISLVRRAMPNLVAYDIAGVQPMSAPTGLIFAMRAKYDSQSGQEALYQEAYSKFSGTGNTSTGAAQTATSGIDPTGSPSLTGFRAILTASAEGLGDSMTFKEMAFTIERVAVEAKTRALKAEYTTELAQDLKAVHGLDAETELANILSAEILAEINREVMRTIYADAITGAQQSDLTSGGTYNLNQDSDGRWSAERFRGLMFQLEREANTIAKETRRGKGNFVICSSDVASALAMGGFLNISPALNNSLDVDDTGNTFVGTLNGKMKVYIDPYAASNVNFAVVGYRGSNPYDAGLFYCPYVPLQMVRAVGENTFQPKIGFKTRYGMVANPFKNGASAASALGSGDNQYYRLMAISNLHGNTGQGPGGGG
ncbi:ATP-binding protein [archaeon]|nr:ATP-binding protein [archaeon]